MTNFTSLPLEITISILLQLDADSIVQLGRVVALPISREVYNHAFLDNTTFPKYDMEMFRQRAEARMYIIGCRPYSPDTGADPKYYERKFINDFTYTRMHTPMQVECKETIVQATISNGDAFLLDCDGEVHHAELRSPFPVTIGGSRMQLKDNYEAGRYVKELAKYRGPDTEDAEVTPPSVISFSEKLFNEPYKPVRFSRLVHGDSQYAVDDRGMVWVPHIILHEWAGWTVVCTVESESIPRADSDAPCFFDGSHISKMDYSLRTICPNGMRSGYGCLDDHCCYVRTQSVPGTSHVKSFAVLDYVIWCLRENGMLAAFDIGHKTNVRWEFPKLDSYGPFVQLEAAGKTVGLVTEKGQVVLARIHRPDSFTYRLVPKLVEGLGNVASIALGEAHSLALTTDGEVYSWGREFYSTASLGLGRYDEMIKMKGVKTEKTCFVVETPTKLKLPKKAFAVIADGRYSGVLM